MSRNIAYQYGWANYQERGGYIAIAWMKFTTFQKDGHEVRPIVVYCINRIHTQYTDFLHTFVPQTVGTLWTNCLN
jgi:hypothetical protein